MKVDSKVKLIKVCIAVLCLAALSVMVYLFGGSVQVKEEEKPKIELAINEVMTSNRTALVNQDSMTPDWIELHNPGGQACSLKGFALTDDLNKPTQYVFPDISIPAGGYLVVYADKSSSKDSPDIYTGFSLSKDGDTIWLVDAAEQLIQKLEIPALGEDISYARAENGSYGYCISPTPAAGNDSLISDLETFRTLAASADLRITEAMPDPAGGTPWVELFNAGPDNVELSLFYLTDNQADPAKWHLPDRSLAPGEYLVVYAAEGEAPDQAFRATFSLSKNDSGIYLYDLAENCPSEIRWDPALLSGSSVVESFLYTMSPTPGSKNQGETFSLQKMLLMDESDPIRINEVLVENKYSITDRDGDRGQWLELSNSSTAALSLAGYFLSDEQDDRFKWAFPDAIINPGDYLLVFLSGKDSDKTQLHASFKISDDEPAIYLTRRSSMRTDVFSLPAKRADNVSFGRDESGNIQYYALPTPLAANAEGFDSLPGMVASKLNGVLFSEVSTVNAALSGMGDWVELHNGSQAPVDLSGWCLSNDLDNLAKWRIESLEIEPGQYLALDEDDFQTSSEPLAISFSGKTLFLSNAGGALTDVFETGVLRSGVSSGRVPDDPTLQRVFFTSATRGAANSGGTASGYADMPAFSRTGLYCSEAFTLAITCTTPGAKIHYTLDGSEPTEKSVLYTEPVLIKENTSLTAVAFADGLLPSFKGVATFLFEKPHTVPVICLTGNPREMSKVFKSASRSYKPEFGVNVAYYKEDGNLGIAFPAGVTPKGRASLGYDQKSVTFKLRGAYGRPEVTYPFFKGSRITTYSEITLRNGGQDILGARMRDSLFQTLSSDLETDTIDTTFAVLYVNGEYWGLYDLEEEQDDGYFKAYFGAEKTNIDLVSRNNKAITGSSSEFVKVRSCAHTWRLGDDEVFAEFAKLVDVEACTDYLIANIYFGNGDMVNQKFWRTRDYSVRWRPLLFDLDWCMRFDDADRNKFQSYFNRDGSIAGDGATTYVDIFYGLKRNAAWRESFINRFIELACSDYDTDQVLQVFDDFIARMEPEMDRQIKRWRLPASLANWNHDTADLRSALAIRKAIVLKQLQNYFGLSNKDFSARVDSILS